MTLFYERLAVCSFTLGFLPCPLGKIMCTMTHAWFLSPITFRKQEKFLLISLTLSHRSMTCAFLLGKKKAVKAPHLLTSGDSGARELGQRL